MTPYQLAALAGVALAAYLLVLAKDAYKAMREADPPVSPGWTGPENPPKERGRYISRVVGKPSTESSTTFWNGEKWCYIDGYECYMQNREWKLLSEGDAQ